MPQETPKDPKGSPKDLQRTPQGPPRNPQGPPKEPQGAPTDLCRRPLLKQMVGGSDTSNVIRISSLFARACDCNQWCALWGEESEIPGSETEILRIWSHGPRAHRSTARGKRREGIGCSGGWEGRGRDRMLNARREGLRWQGGKGFDLCVV